MFNEISKLSSNNFKAEFLFNKLKLKIKVFISISHSPPRHAPSALAASRLKYPSMHWSHLAPVEKRLQGHCPVESQLLEEATVPLD